MSDIFISYAKEDRAKAAELAAAMESQGWTVWWDRQIPPGRTFDEVIEEALTTARCVIVLWSGLSIASRWVRAEASSADERGILVPVLIESVSPPLEFRRIQAADLINWQGDRDNPELQTLLTTVRGLVSANATVPRRQPVPVAHPRASQPSQTLRFAAVAMASLLAGAGLVYSLLRPALSGDIQEPQTADAVREPTSTAPSNVPAQPPQNPTGVAASGRINLLSTKNGGHLVRAPHENWNTPIDEIENWDYINGDEAVYAFKDNQPATFDTFRMLITETRAWNIKEFELSAGDAADGTFESIGKFETQNVRLFPSAWQDFKFPPRRARYLKVRVLSLHSPSGLPQVEQWQLLGSF
jgi:hypothetical protein